MRKLLMFAILTGYLLFSAGCNPFAEKEADYFPISIGSTWQNLMLSIKVTSGLPDTTSMDTVGYEVKGEAQLPSGDNAFLIEMNEGGYIDTVYSRKTDDFVLFYEDFDDDEPDTILKFPIEDADPWRVDEDILARVVGQENRTVVAGAYKDCWKVNYTDDGDPLFDRWYAPNIGLCLENLEETYQGVTWIERTELIEVNIK